MSAPLLSKTEVLDRVFGVFQTYGYDGASLARISTATGLGRASLYHYFPGGKDEMAAQVLAVSKRWLEDRVIAPLAGDGEVSARLASMFANLRRGYDDGRASCLLNLFGIGDAATKFGSPLNDTIGVWVSGLERALRAAGVKRAAAHRLALGAVVRVEGALVVARALRDNTVFLRTLVELESELGRATAGGD